MTEAKRIVVSREWEFETTEQRDEFLAKWDRDPGEAIDWYYNTFWPALVRRYPMFKGRAKD